MRHTTLSLLFVASTFIATGCNEHSLGGMEDDSETGYGESGSGGDVDEDDGLPLDNGEGSGGGGGGFDFTADRCGDREVNSGEECDEGADNDDNGACTSECRMNVCGDGLVFEGGEQCDDGENNGVYTVNGFCDANCDWMDQ